MYLFIAEWGLYNARLRRFDGAAGRKYDLWANQGNKMLDERAFIDYNHCADFSAGP